MVPSKRAPRPLYLSVGAPGGIEVNRGWHTSTPGSLSLADAVTGSLSPPLSEAGAVRGSERACAFVCVTTTAVLLVDTRLLQSLDSRVFCAIVDWSESQTDGGAVVVNLSMSLDDSVATSSGSGGSGSSGGSGGCGSSGGNGGSGSSGGNGGSGSSGGNGGSGGSSLTASALG